MDALLESLYEDVTDFITSYDELIYSEVDLQLQLAVALMNKPDRYDDVFAEYFVPSAKVEPHGYKKGCDIYLDIVVRRGKKFAAVELKYPTDELTVKNHRSEVPHFRFGDALKDPEIRLLKNHSAHDIRSYDFWEDVHRIEVVRTAYAHKVVGGLAVMVTNDPYYIKGPTKKGAIHTNFSTADGRVAKGELAWIGESATSDKRRNITLKGEYPVKWHKDEMKIEGFLYTIIPVELNELNS